MSVFKRISYMWGAGLSSSARMTSWVAAFTVFGVWYYVDQKMASYNYKKMVEQSSTNSSIGRDNESSSSEDDAAASESSKSKSECTKTDCGCSGDNKKTDSAGR